MCQDGVFGPGLGYGINFYVGNVEYNWIKPDDRTIGAPEFTNGWN